MYVKIKILAITPGGVLLTLEYIDWQFLYLRMKVSYVVKEGYQVDCQLSLHQPIDAKP